MLSNQPQILQLAQTITPAKAQPTIQLFTSQNQNAQLPQTQQLQAIPQVLSMTKSQVIQPIQSYVEPQKILVKSTKVPTDHPFQSILRQLICLIPIILALFALAMTAILIHTYNKTDEKYHHDNEVLKFAEKNLRAKPIFDIMSIPHTSQCDTSQGWSTLIYGTFPKTQTGCVCTDGTAHSRAYCILMPRFSYSCTINDGTSEQQIKLWPKQSTIDKTDIQQLCVKYNSQVYIYNQKESKCPDPKNQRLCGTKDFCVSNLEECPLNRFEESVDPLNPPNQKFVHIGGKKFGFYQDPAYLDISPFIAPKVHPGYPCWEEDRVSKFASEQAYPLLAQKPIGCGNGYGQVIRYFVDFQIPVNEMKLYELNTFNNVVNDLPYSSQFFKDTDNLNLYMERQIKHNFYKSQCFNIDESSIQSLRERSRVLAKWIYWLAIAVMVLSILALFTGLIFFIRRRSISKKNPVRLIYILALLIFLVVIAGFVIYYYYNTGDDAIENKVKVVDEYFANNCFYDQELNDALTGIRDYGKKSTKTFGYLWKWLFWVSVALALIALIFVIMKTTQFKAPILQNPWVSFVEE